MLRLIIDMHKGPLNVAQPFHLALQTLADVVRDFEGEILIHNDVYFDVIFLAGVVGATLLAVNISFPRHDDAKWAYRINFLNMRVMRDRHINKFADELFGGGFAHQEPHLLKGVGHPREQDEQRDADGTYRIQVPHKSLTDNGHNQTENIHDDVVAVVNLSKFTISDQGCSHRLRTQV